MANKSLVMEVLLRAKNDAIMNLNQAKNAKIQDPQRIYLAAIAAIRAELEYITSSDGIPPHMLGKKSPQHRALEASVSSIVSMISCCGDLYEDPDKKYEFWMIIHQVSMEALAGCKATKVQPTPGSLVKVPVNHMEYREGQKTIWIQSPRGTTVLRIKTAKKISSTLCESAPSTHSDINVSEEINVCLSDDAEVENE